MKKKLVLAVLLIAMLLSALNCTAFAAGTASDAENSNPVRNVVLLIDCSGTMSYHDTEHYAVAAQKNFIDMFPDENMNISVIMFGYQKTEADLFKFNSENRNNLLYDEMNRIHVIYQLNQLTGTNNKENLKSEIESILDESDKDYKNHNSQTSTPIGHALTAAVQMLGDNETAAGYGDIILVSDGVNSVYSLVESERDFDTELVNTASTEAGENGWKIYSVGLNYANNGKKEKQTADELMNTMCENSASEKVGYLPCSTEDEVIKAMGQIFCDIFDGDPKETTLPIDEDFEVPQLTSELNYNICGTNITSVTLTNEDTGESQTFTDNVETETAQVSRQENAYFNVKLICPEAGNWHVHVEGTESAMALRSLVTLQDMTLVMETEAKATLSKTDTIKVNAYFTYLGEARSLKFYETTPATLTITDTDGNDLQKAIEMTADSNGYYAELSLQDMSSGRFNLCTVVESDVLDGGKKVSNSESFRLGNIEPEATKGTIERSASANSAFDPIAETDLFTNPDNDPLEYTITSSTDPSDVFDFTVGENGLVIEAGNRCGDYEVEVGVKDPDMDSYVTRTVTLHIENLTLESEKLPHTTLLLNPYSFYKTARTEYDLDLNEYFTDPEDLPITYTVSTDEVVNTELFNGQLKITPKSVGETTITVTASDGFNTVSNEMTVKVANGKTVYWQHYGIFYAIALAIIVIIIFAIVIILKNKRVKGSWKITIDENGMQTSVEHFDIGAFTICGRKSKFKLSELLPEILQNMDGAAPAIMLDLGNFQTGTSSVTMIGVYGKKGLGVKYNPPKGVDAKTTVNCNGTIVTKSASMKGGYFSVTVEDMGGNTLTFTME